MQTLSQRLALAINVAADCHDGHYRKASGIPYTSHLFGVMHILSQHNASEDLLIAGLLHDVMEDRPDRYSFADMNRDFGPAVVYLVQAVTKNSALPTWQDRAENYLAGLTTATDEAVLLCLADKYHNLLSILMDYEQVGEQVWDRFNAGKQRQYWWYHAVLNLANSRLPQHALTADYAQLVAQLDKI